MKKAFVADLEKFATLISQFESHKTQLQSKIGDLTAQNEAKGAVYIVVPLPSVVTHSN
jgi:hypothetical protein